MGVGMGHRCLSNWAICMENTKDDPFKEAGFKFKIFCSFKTEVKKLWLFFLLVV